MKKYILLVLITLGVMTTGFSATNKSSNKKAKYNKKEAKMAKKAKFSCTITYTCGGLSGSVTAATCAEAGAAIDRACDKGPSPVEPTQN